MINSGLTTSGPKLRRASSSLCAWGCKISAVPHIWRTLTPGPLCSLAYRLNTPIALVGLILSSMRSVVPGSVQCACDTVDAEEGRSYSTDGVELGPRAQRRPNMRVDS